MPKTTFSAMTRSPLSLLGAALTTLSAVLILSLFAIELMGFTGGPYIGILAFVILPSIFVFGLVLIPIGIWRHRKRVARGEGEDEYPVVNLNAPQTRRTAMVVLLLTAVNVVIIVAATYKGVEVMDSPEFCGKACHKVMQPEYTGWQNSPHARVACVNCHIGPGADWFVRSKLSGSWQLIAVTFNLYPRPIPSPVHNLRPARETCEQCHWPTKFVGDRLKVITHYDDDETNTPKKNVLLVRVGGREGASSTGIHWHVDPRVTIRYRSDDKRERVDVVELTKADGTKVVFEGPDAGKAQPATAEKGAKGEGGWRVMDCVDCHNRPTHVYRLPEVAVDDSMMAGTIDPKLPFVHRESVRLLRQTYASHDEAGQKMAAGLAQFYAEKYPDLAKSQAKAIEAAGQELGAIYARNVFPRMNVGWGTYPNHIGHQDEHGGPGGTGGCFRCHDDQHKSKDGQTIGQDCATCHAALAMDDPDPAVLKTLNP